MATIKTWKVTSPNGEVTITRDLNSLCAENFDNSHQSACGLRSNGTYKGWKCEETDAILDEDKMAQFNPHFSYVRSEGSSFVRVVCKECGTEYVYTPFKLESKRIGCGSCYEKKRGFSLKGKKIDTTSRNVCTQEEGFKAVRENLGDVEIKLLEEWHGKATKINVLCPTHGWYESTIDCASKHKCKKCADIINGKKNRDIPPKYITPKEVLGRLTRKFGYTPNVRFPQEWKGSESDIEIECPLHGWYTQNVYSSYKYSTGCKECRYESIGLKSRISQENAFEEIFANLGYETEIKVNGKWVGNQTPIEVCCHTHGWYTTTVENARQFNCPKCSDEERMKLHGRKYIYEGEKFDSKWEIYVFSYLMDNGIPFERERAIKYVTESNNKSHNYYCDFYLTEEDRFVEVKGTQFFTEDGTINSPWTEGLTEERVSELTEMYSAKHGIAKENDVVYVTSVEHVNPSWFQYNEGVQMEDISKYQSWFYKHHTDLDISV